MIDVKVKFLFFIPISLFSNSFSLIFLTILNLGLFLYTKCQIKILKNGIIAPKISNDLYFFDKLFIFFLLKNLIVLMFKKLEKISAISIVNNSIITL